MLFRILFTLSMLLFLPVTYAKETAIPLDLLELLGELEDDDTEALEATLTEIELKDSQNKTKGTKAKTAQTEQSTTLPQETQK